MRERAASSRRAPVARPRYTVDVVLVAAQARQLLVRCATRGEGRKTWELPWTVPRSGETLDGAARRVARVSAAADPTWLEQIGAFSDGRRHPGDATLSIGFVAAVPQAASVGNLGTAEPWLPLDQLPALVPRQRAMVDGALDMLRTRIDHAPIPFRFLPASFTLSDLQQVYETLLGHDLHKASFRRALHAAWLVEPTDEWRSEGRGRPAQLFRFAPRKRRGHRRSVRFDLL